MVSSDVALLAAWAAEERAQPEGWDFSSLDGRMSESSEPWDLAAVWRTALTSGTRVLDMGTGGGEFLARFADALPEHTVATEGWLPNLGVARSGLAPYDVGVVGADPDEPGGHLPFADGSFDLVLNRHESYDPAEVWRTLSPAAASSPSRSEETNSVKYEMHSVCRLTRRTSPTHSFGPA
ncbi:class I SAM-dependent methyltransferase [Flexivirga alba]|uniref:Class I SAM-dependent methyltransferase n=1 Tax=Flexivirga alba TaxID=702742 RepID=A0ABW2AGL7_9MICO